SNIGSHYIQEYAISDPEAMRKGVMETVRGHFRPEFLNRLDEVVIFNSLDRQEIKQIVEIQLRKLVERLAERNIHLHVTDRAKDHLAEEGYDAVFGARPLKRTIQKQIQDVLALKLLEGEFRNGADITADVAPNGEMVFTRQDEGALVG
ncbi:MAG: type VI secretion system ATPase TssH, partial [Armatimonadota bacterium]|nr:type VI secretion system ATPase TssH [Armatimonadota bacterium]